MHTGLAASRQRQGTGRDNNPLVGGLLSGLGGAEITGPAAGLAGGGAVKAGRRKGRKDMDVEKSLDSLSVFRRSHMGRLGLFEDEARARDEAGDEHSATGEQQERAVASRADGGGVTWRLPRRRDHALQGLEGATALLPGTSSSPSARVSADTGASERCGAEIANTGGQLHGEDAYSRDGDMSGRRAAGEGGGGSSVSSVALPIEEEVEPQDGAGAAKAAEAAARGSGEPERKGTEKLAEEGGEEEEEEDFLLGREQVKKVEASFRVKPQVDCIGCWWW